MGRVAVGWRPIGNIRHAPGWNGLSNPEPFKADSDPLRRYQMARASEATVGQDRHRNCRSHRRGTLLLHREGCSDREPNVFREEVRLGELCEVRCMPWGFFPIRSGGWSLEEGVGLVHQTSVLGGFSSCRNRGEAPPSLLEADEQ